MSNVELDCYIQVVGDLSIGIYVDAPEFGVEQDMVWIPLSQIEDKDYIGLAEPDQLTSIEIPEWLATEKGLV